MTTFLNINTRKYTSEDYVLYPPALKVGEVFIVFNEIGTELEYSKSVPYENNYYSSLVFDTETSFGKFIIESFDETGTENYDYNFSNIDGGVTFQKNGVISEIRYVMYSTISGLNDIRRILAAHNKSRSYALFYPNMYPYDYKINDELINPYAYQCEVTISNRTKISNIFTNNERVFDGEKFTLTIKLKDPVINYFYTETEAYENYNEGSYGDGYYGL